jgi:hypothetical protein
VDPGPDDVGRWVRIDPRLIPWPTPGDPAPFDRVRFPNLKLADALSRISNVAAADLTPEHFSAAKVSDLLRHFAGGGKVDPSPEDTGRATASALPTARDLAAMTPEQRQATAHKLEADIRRLQSLREAIAKLSDNPG